MQFARGMGVAWYVLLGSLLIAGWFWHLARIDEDRLTLEHFEFRVNETKSAISERMGSYEQMLMGFVGLLNATGTIARQQWRDYYKSLHIEKRYPGIQTVGFARYIPAADREMLIRQIRAEGFPDFTLWPAEEHAYYTPVILSEPAAGPDRLAFGFDMSSEPVRRAALQQAGDSGAIVFSDRILLPQAADDRVLPGFIVFLPVYRQDLPLATLEQRRAALLGYVYSTFQMSALMADIGKLLAPDMRLRIYDGQDIAPHTQLYDSALTASGWEPSGLRMKTELMLGNHSWMLVVTARAPVAPTAFPGRFSSAVLLIGVLVSLLLFLSTWSLATTRRRAQLLAQRMTAAIRESETRLREITAALKEGVYVQDLQGRVTFVNPETQKLLGWSIEAMLGQDAHRLFHLNADGAVPANGVCALLETVRRGDSYQAEDAAFRRKDGTLLAVAVVALPLRRQGQLAGAVVAFRDITQRKQAEAALRESLRFRSLFEYSREALLLIDASGRIIDVNRLACDNLGYTRERLLLFKFFLLYQQYQ